MTSPYSSFGRPPLSASRLERAVAAGGVWHEVRVVAQTASTNRDVATEAKSGAASGLVVIAEHQTGGRGRLDRQWESPARAGLLMSALVRPPVDAARWPLLPLLTGLAVIEAVISVGAVDATLKWPNDVLVNSRKLAGILCERVDDAIVIGVGLNISTRPDELPIETATSLAIEGGTTDREPIVKEVLRSLARRYTAWCDTAGSPDSVIPAYRERCETIGREITLQLPGGDTVSGRAAAIDDEGRLVVVDRATGESRPWLVGDVTHVRAAE